MPRNQVNISILGTSFSVMTDEDPERMERILIAYRNRVEETQKRSGSGDPLKVAIITGLLLTDQLMKTESCVTMDKDDGADDLAEQMIRCINDAVKNV